MKELPWNLTVLVLYNFTFWLNSANITQPYYEVIYKPSGDSDWALTFPLESGDVPCFYPIGQQEMSFGKVGGKLVLGIEIIFNILNI